MKELLEADEIIVSSSTKLVLRACELEGQPVGGKASDLFKKLQNAYVERFLRETENGR